VLILGLIFLLLVVVVGIVLVVKNCFWDGKNKTGETKSLIEEQKIEKSMRRVRNKQKKNNLYAQTSSSDVKIELEMQQHSSEDEENKDDNEEDEYDSYEKELKLSDKSPKIKRKLSDVSEEDEEKPSAEDNPEEEHI